MYQGGLSKSEMEKTATRKFTSRAPRIDVKLTSVQENNIQDETISNENENLNSPSADESEIDSDAIMEAIQNELSSEQSIAAEENLSSEKMSMIKNEIIQLCEQRQNGKEITYKACLNYVSANK